MIALEKLARTAAFDEAIRLCRNQQKKWRDLEERSIIEGTANPWFGGAAIGCEELGNMIGLLKDGLL